MLKYPKENTYLRNVLDKRNQKLDVGEQVQVDEHIDSLKGEQNGGSDRDRPESDEQTDARPADRLVLAFVDAEALDQRDHADDEGVYGEHHVIVLDRYQTKRILKAVLALNNVHIAHRHVEDRIEEEAGHIQGDEIEI